MVFIELIVQRRRALDADPAAGEERREIFEILAHGELAGAEALASHLRGAAHHANLASRRAFTRIWKSCSSTFFIVEAFMGAAPPEP